MSFNSWPRGIRRGDAVMSTALCVSELNHMVFARNLRVMVRPNRSDVYHFRDYTHHKLRLSELHIGRVGVGVPSLRF